jgi:hypothetical protein
MSDTHITGSLSFPKQKRQVDSFAGTSGISFWDKLGQIESFSLFLFRQRPLNTPST